MSDRLARILGIAIQASVMGTLLFFALLKFAGVMGGASVFHYEGF